jgi:hypothetical protein
MTASPHCSPRPPAALARLTAAERAELADILGALERRAPTFRQFAERPDLCGLDLSPLVAAIMDASEGVRPATIDDAACARHFGCAREELPRAPPRTVVVRAGGRGGKTSRLLATKALHAAWTVPVPLLGKGEAAYALLVAPSMRLARQALAFCKGYVDASPVLAAAKASDGTDHIALRRPDGAPVRIEVFAAGRGGAQLRAKTLVFVGLDEAAFFRDEATGLVNDAELYRAVLQRVVPGGQVWLPTTPWLAGVGLVEEFIAKDWGTHLHALCVVAGTRALNPAWDPTGEVERDLRAQDPDAAEREIDAVPLAGGSQLFFSPEAVTAAVDERRPQQLPKTPGRAYGAGGDCAFKRNSSALVVVERDGDGDRARYRVALVEELKPTAGTPLKPSGVVDRFAAALDGFGVGELVVDSHERGEVALELARHGKSAVDAPDKVGSYILARTLLHEGKVELPKHPRLVRQLRDVVAKPQPGGGLAISSPRKADGSHGDLVSALVLALWRAAADAPYESTRIRSTRR